MIGLRIVKNLFPSLVDELVVFEKRIGALVLIDEREWGMPLSHEEALEIAEVVGPLLAIHDGILFDDAVDADLFTDTEAEEWWDGYDVIDDVADRDGLLDPDGIEDQLKCATADILACVKSIVGICRVLSEIDEATEKKMVEYGVLKLSSICSHLESHLIIDFEIGSY